MAVFCAPASQAQPFILQKIIERGGTAYLSNEIIVKFRKGVQLPSSGSVPGFFKNSAAGKLLVSALPLFPSEPGLDRIYSAYFSGPGDASVLSKKLSGLAEIEWAEPRYVYLVDHIPNDSQYVNQWALAKVSAPAAWDISKGDTSVIIGIIDTGIDWDHPDLAANIWYNRGEIAGNGIDDDRNGYKDDIRGWDFGGTNGTPDNNPMEDKPDHGTHVAGIAGAVTNNARGIASLGYNCRLMAVKASQDNYRANNGSPYIVYGYEAIIYAASNGCKVINCSWGGYSFSLFGQEAVDYATSKGALVVAAAGNDNSSDRHYPSAYKNVLSVASTSQGDMKSAFSNYGTTVDVCAPGEAILSTWMNDTYYYNGGTSMASPLAAGLAGLVASRFPSYSPLQTAEQLRVTCDNINPQNPGLRGDLGKGRINAFKALSTTGAVSCRAYEITYDDSSGDNDGVIEHGELIRLKARFRNYLAPFSSMNIGLESVSPYASVIQTNYFPPASASSDSFTNYSSPFTFRVSAGVPYNSTLKFALNYISGNTIDEQWITLVANPSYATQKGNEVAVTITSKGNLGFADYPDNLQGDGFKYKGSSNLLFEGALITGVSSSQISNSARNANQGKAQDQDFSTVQPFVLSIPGTDADVEGRGSFSDEANPSGSLGTRIQLRSYSFSNTGYRDYIVLRYLVSNTSTKAINNYYIGLYTDWDLTASGLDDVTEYDAAGRLGYCRHVGTGQNILTGTALLSTMPVAYCGILNDGGDGGFSVYDGFSDAEKWKSLSDGTRKDGAGAGDVSYVVGTGPFSIAPGGGIDVAFALIAGSTLQELRGAAAKADSQYAKMNTQIPASGFQFSLSQNKPNPARFSSGVEFEIDFEGAYSLILYDILGREVNILYRGLLSPGKYSVAVNASALSSGAYFYVLRGGGRAEMKKMMVIR